MRPFLILYCMTQITISIDVCFWGRDGANSHINGQYTESGNWNGYPYYTMTVDSSCSPSGVYHLYYLAGNWWIADTLNSQIYMATCQNSNDPRTGNAGGCNNKWNIGGIDTDIQLSYGRCPEWNCDQITTSWPSVYSCGTIFDTHTSNNEWVGNHNTFGTMYLYFHPQIFAFVCDSTLKYTCPQTFAAVDLSLDGWSNTSAGAGISMNWFSGRYESLTCIAPTNSPTVSPVTALPTTRSPTTYSPTTRTPTTQSPTTSIPTTTRPTSMIPTTIAPASVMPTTTFPIPTTAIPTTTAPSTMPSIIPSTAHPTANTPTSILMLPTRSPTNVDIRISGDITTTFSSHKREYLQNKGESYFIILIICILLVIICITCIAACVIVRRKRMKNEKRSNGATTSIELANKVNKSDGTVLKETKFAPQSIVKISFTEKSGESGNTTTSLMNVVSLSDMNSVTSGGDSNHIDTTPTNTETPEDDINHNVFGEGHGNESDSDLYESNNNINDKITPGITAGNDEITPQ